MNMKALLGTAMTAVALSIGATSVAVADDGVATLARITGDAVVSKGAQYVSGTEGMALKIGARVMSLAASSAVIQFNDGCRYVLEANQLLTVENQSPCALGLVSQEGGAGAVGAGHAGAAGLAWVPVAGVGLVGVMGGTFPTGHHHRYNRRPISQEE